MLKKPGGMKKISSLSQRIGKNPGEMINSAFKRTTGRGGKTIPSSQPQFHATRKDIRMFGQGNRLDDIAYWRRELRPRKYAGKDAWKKGVDDVYREIMSKKIAGNL
tara:strand:+ start:420 stop:737 length:318 start_codon:yes stop_codon:yes gene_type:complete